MKISKINKKLLTIPLLLLIFTILISFPVYATSTAKSNISQSSTFSSTNYNISPASQPNISTATQSIIYVSSTGNDGWSGKSPIWNGIDGPKKSIGNAIKAINTGGTVKIASGTYKENNIAITKNMIIQGEQNTVIDAQHLNRILTISPGIVVKINNLKFTNGQSSSGGAIQNKGSLTLTSCIFSNNKVPNYGGAINNVNSSLIIKSCSFSDNTAKAAGAISNVYGNLAVINSTLSNNIANGGGGGSIINSRGSMTINSSTFTNNKAFSNTGGAFYSVSGPLTVNQNKFTGNTASNMGGAIYCENTVGKTCFDRNNFDNNAAGRGGAIYWCNGSLTVSSNTFTSNKADGSSGAVYIDGTGLSDPNHSNVNIVKSAFNGNTANRFGGAVYNNGLCNIDSCYFTSNTANIDGGAVANAQGNLVITSSTFKDNRAANNGGALYGYYGTIKVTYSTFVNNNALNLIYKDIFYYKTSIILQNNKFS